MDHQHTLLATKNCWNWGKWSWLQTWVVSTWIQEQLLKGSVRISRENLVLNKFVFCLGDPWGSKLQKLTMRMQKFPRKRILKRQKYRKLTIRLQRRSRLLPKRPNRYHSPRRLKIRSIFVWYIYCRFFDNLRRIICTSKMMNNPFIILMLILWIPRFWCRSA